MASMAMDEMEARQTYCNVWHSDLIGTITADCPYCGGVDIDTSMPGLSSGDMKTPCKDSDSLDALDLPEPDEELCEFIQDEVESVVQWDLGEEEEKACSDRIVNVANTTHRFSRVYEVDIMNGKTLIPKLYKPVHGSPSSQVKKNPFTLCEAIYSSRRIRVTFEERESKSARMVYGTAFKVSQRMACSARHCFKKDGMSLVKVEMCQGSIVSARTFDSSSFQCKLKRTTIQHWGQTKDNNGLFQEGADVAFFQGQDETESFLLPCSPSFLSAKQRKSVAILSYPSIHNMLQKAKEDLNKSGMSPTWKTYQPAMTKDIDNAIQKLAAGKGVSLEDASIKEELTKNLLQQIKKTLLNDLQETFGGFSTGSLLCAVGSLIGSNNVAIGTTCSTLRGSSGAAVCIADLPGYFIGIHSGGVCGYDMNGATSADNEEFVEMYVTCVLPTLPSVTSTFWKSINPVPFLLWLELHAANIPKGSPWLGKTLGRAREYAEIEGHRAKRRSMLLTGRQHQVLMK